MLCANWGAIVCLLIGWGESLARDYAFLVLSYGLMIVVNLVGVYPKDWEVCVAVIAVLRLVLPLFWAVIPFSVAS